MNVRMRNSNRVSVRERRREIYKYKYIYIRDIYEDDNQSTYFSSVGFSVAGGRGGTPSSASCDTRVAQHVHHPHPPAERASAPRIKLLCASVRVSSILMNKKCLDGLP